MQQAPSKTLSQVLATQDNSLKAALKADPSSESLHPNKEPREVFGQYVEVSPTPLPEPYLVVVSDDMARELGLNPSEASTEAFVKLFSGDIKWSEVQPWATPYAVSVFGQPILSPDPFGRGNGYGDGRALSLGEFSCADSAGSTSRWELQLKGSGTTPFSRGGDGRAVLRSSIREFLVSEAMDAMGVPTTRALCLVASGSEYTRRLWYAPDDKARDHPPDTLITERCAITCRAAPSFLRVGHIELWSRRAARGDEGAAAELQALVRHAISREFGEVDASQPLRVQLMEVARAFAKRQAELAVHWLRVGYVQGNMNSDNCLLSGRTMDYGPFGFMERYEPLWSPFTSDMERKFGFERQPLAAQVNVMTLVKALLPLFERLDDYDDAVDELQAIVKESYSEYSVHAKHEMLRCKLGLVEFDAYAAESLFPELQELMAKSAVDYTLLWRQLSYISDADAAAAAAATAAVEAAGTAEAGEAAGAEEAACHAQLLRHVEPCFYSSPPDPLRKEWAQWLTHYACRVHADARPESERVAEMRGASPKYIPREWMLASAYTAAEKGDHSIVQELFALFRAPFDEHPELEAKYYRRTPEDVQGKAGISYFS